VNVIGGPAGCAVGADITKTLRLAAIAG